MPFKARRRCFFFDANGNPVDGGCTRTRYTCRFVHPDDDWWDELQPYVRKSGRSKSPGYNRPREREWDKPDRERDRGWHKTEEVWESDRTKTQRRDRERDDRDRDKEQRHDNEYLQRKERDKPRRISDVDRSRSRSNSQERHLDHNWGTRKTTYYTVGVLSSKNHTKLRGKKKRLKDTVLKKSIWILVLAFGHPWIQVKATAKPLAGEQRCDRTTEL
ncbi:hypothetical protein BDQ17DRAFT_1320890 [Cyathus striatus]|nr:hypothetical protein BDQ17DRAFT_1320890 [Cyathus striatus]